jgi:hypothetical protein
MATTLNGRTLPKNDWEGDDFTPNAGGHYVTCMDTATGRAMAWSTNGRVDVDGRVVRKNVIPPDANGVGWAEMEKAVPRINSHLELDHKSGWNRTSVGVWLKGQKGLIVIGRYSSIPRMYRHQSAASFTHAMFVTHFNQAGTLMRLYDPLDPRLDLRGRSVPTSILWPFLDDLGWQAGWVPLHHL